MGAWGRTRANHYNPVRNAIRQSSPTAPIKAAPTRGYVPTGVAIWTSSTPTTAQPGIRESVGSY